ncbi:MAG: ABC transporter permease [Ardenticatenaceae bacterium]|nr:ABC transporter permease [Anaerolineales bacterium]MCB8923702.1 ABC transporter permease [Ardenticatenaceae bacterium]
MRVVDLAIKDLRQILRERQSAFFLLIMPVVFTLLFGFAFGGFGGGDDEDPRLPVGFLNQDAGTVSEDLVTLLAQSDVIRLVTDTMDVADLETQVKDGVTAAAVIVPAGYGQHMTAGELVPLTVIVDSGNASGITAQEEVTAAVTRLLSALQTAQVGMETAVSQNVISESDKPAYFETTLARAITAWAAPPIQVAVSQSGAVDESGTETAVSSDNAFAHSSPGMMAQFAIAGLITAAQILVLERKSGSLRRLLTTDMSRGSILLGHYLAMFVTILAQLFILILFGQLFLKLPYFQEPAATLLLTVASALFAASLGLLIGALAQSEEQAIIFSLVPMFVLAGLGGAWVPLEFTPEGFQRIAFFTPIAWMMDGFKDIIVRGLGLEAVLLATAVLIIYAIIFWGLAAWRFRFE